MTLRVIPLCLAAAFGAVAVAAWVPVAGTAATAAPAPPAPAGAPIPLAEVRTWAYQIQGLDRPGAIDELANSPYDLLVVEPTRTETGSDFDTRGMVRRLKAAPAGDGRHGKRVLAYLSIGEAEQWRWYWTWPKWPRRQPRPEGLPAFIIHPDPDGWGGCFPVAYWDPAWKDLVIYGARQPAAPDRDFTSMLGEVLRDGFDGVYLDWVEAYDDRPVAEAARKAGVDARAEMVALMAAIRAEGRRRNPDFLVIQQNAASLIEDRPEVLEAVDGIGQEDTWCLGRAGDKWDDPRGYDKPQKPADTKEYLRLLDLYRKAGKVVLTVDYTVTHAAEVYARSRERGYVPYCTRISLARLTTTPPPTRSAP